MVNSFAYKRKAPFLNPLFPFLDFSSLNPSQMINLATADEDQDMFPKSVEIKRLRRMSPPEGPVNVGARQRGESCANGDICLSGTSCINGACQCPKGFIPKVSKDLKWIFVS